MCRAALMTSGFASTLVARYLDCNVADVYQLETFAFDCFLFFFMAYTTAHTTTTSTAHSSILAMEYLPKHRLEAW